MRDKVSGTGSLPQSAASGPSPSPRIQRDPVLTWGGCGSTGCLQLNSPSRRPLAVALHAEFGKNSGTLELVTSLIRHLVTVHFGGKQNGNGRRLGYSYHALGIATFLVPEAAAEAPNLRSRRPRKGKNTRCIDLPLLRGHTGVMHAKLCSKPPSWRSCGPTHSKSVGEQDCWTHTRNLGMARRQQPGYEAETSADCPHDSSRLGMLSIIGKLRACLRIHLR